MDGKEAFSQGRPTDTYRSQHENLTPDIQRVQDLKVHDRCRNISAFPNILDAADSRPVSQ